MYRLVCVCGAVTSFKAESSACRCLRCWRPAPAETVEPVVARPIVVDEDRIARHVVSAVLALYGIAIACVVAGRYDPIESVALALATAAFAAVQLRAPGGRFAAAFLFVVLGPAVLHRLFPREADCGLVCAVIPAALLAIVLPMWVALTKLSR